MAASHQQVRSWRVPAFFSLSGVPEFKPLAGGFLPRCWTDGGQVLKVWDDGLPASLPVLAALDLPVVVPMATAVIAGWGVAVFPFVSGREATSDDAPVLARTMRRMHDHPLVDLPRPPIEECWALETMRGPARPSMDQRPPRRGRGATRPA